MDTITIIGMVSGLATLFCVAVYVISIAKSDPRLILRMWDETDRKHAFIFGNETYLRFGISTKRKQPILLDSVRIQLTHLDEIKLSANDQFQPRPTGSGLSLIWSGEEPLQKKHFVMFELPFKRSLTTQSNPFTVNISATATIEPSTWRFPWSMFSPHKKNANFGKIIQWKQDPPDGTHTGFRLEPGESCFVFGDAAKREVIAGGEKIDVLTTEVFHDNAYKISRVTSQDDQE